MYSGMATWVRRIVFGLVAVKKTCTANGIT